MTKTIHLSEKNKPSLFPINRIYEDTFSITKIEDIDFQKLQESISKRESNILSPIIIRPNKNDGWTIVDGVKRFNAMKSAGFTDIYAIEQDISDKEARILAIKMNRGRGEFDQIKLAQLIKELKVEFHMNNLDLQEELGFEPEEIYALETLADIEDDSDFDEAKDAQELEDNIGVLENDSIPSLYDKIAIDVSQEEMSLITSLAVKTGLTKEKAIYASIAMMKDESR